MSGFLQPLSGHICLDFVPEENERSKISRHAFLKRMGFQGASLLAVYCSGFISTSCSVEKGSGTDEDFTIDISKGKFKELSKTNGWIKVRNVVIARTGTDSFSAVTSICSHEGENQIIFRPAEGDFRCAAHGAEFDLAGNGKNKKGRKGLTLYQVKMQNSILHVTLPKK
jgi:nitrite reductase/ring-hydroxylating ferredoxin subunit